MSPSRFALVFLLVLFYTPSLLSQTLVSIRVFLEGAYTDNRRMDTQLCNVYAIPHTDPYGLGIAVPSIPDNTVDWLYIEFRKTPTSAPVLRTAAFLQKDGYVVNWQGEPWRIPNTELPAGLYYLVIAHRNHLPIMSARPVQLHNKSALYDFSTSIKSMYNGSLSSVCNRHGVLMMCAGDVTGNYRIDSLDYATVRAASGTLQGYGQTDPSLDLLVDAEDRVLTRDNAKYNKHATLPCLPLYQVHNVCWDTLYSVAVRQYNYELRQHFLGMWEGHFSYYDTSSCPQLPNNFSVTLIMTEQEDSSFTAVLLPTSHISEGVPMFAERYLQVSNMGVQINLLAQTIALYTTTAERSMVLYGKASPFHTNIYGSVEIQDKKSLEKFSLGYSLHRPQPFHQPLIER